MAGNGGEGGHPAARPMAVDSFRTLPTVSTRSNTEFSEVFSMRTFGMSKERGGGGGGGGGKGE